MANDIGDKLHDVCLVFVTSSAVEKALLQVSNVDFDYARPDSFLGYELIYGFPIAYIFLIRVDKYEFAILVLCHQDHTLTFHTT